MRVSQSGTSVYDSGSHDDVGDTDPQSYTQDETKTSLERYVELCREKQSDLETKG